MSAILRQTILTSPIGTQPAKFKSDELNFLKEESFMNRKVGIAVVAGFVSLTSFSAFAQGPDPSQVYVNNFTYAGSGCPSGTVASDISEDAQAFTLLFDRYIAEAGPGIARSENRKNCNVLLNLHVPAGWSFTIMSVDYRGFAQLDSGTIGEEVSEYYFQGQRGPAFSTSLRGPYNDDYVVSDDIPIQDMVWSQCGVNRALNIKTQVRVNASYNRRALMTLDSIDGEFRQIYHMQWRRCR